LHFFGPDERALAPFTEGASLKAFGVAVELQTLWIWGLTALAVVALALLYRKTAFGRAMRATAIRRDAARLVGINAGMMVTVAFALAAGLGALAGVAVAPLTQTAFGVGAAIGVKGFAAAILGGIGNPISAVAGGLMLGLLESFAAGYFDPAYKDGVALVVLLVVLFVAPQGLLAKAGRVKV
jgi:branched-chain amino acid transport system permease protein